MPRRREVTVDAVVDAKAQLGFPPGGSSDGRPSYELLRERALDAVVEAWSRNFEASPESEPGSPVRVALTFPAPMFPPMAFYGILVGDGVHIIDYSHDDDYWDTVEDVT